MLLVETGYPWSSLKEPSVSSGAPRQVAGAGISWNVVGQGREDPGGKVLTDPLRSAWSEP